MPGKRQAGWPFSIGYFLFGHTKRKELPQAHESSCLEL
jgi:hypothetical protein